MIPAREALDRLREGNRRFASDLRSHDTPVSRSRRTELATKQQPFAIVLGCADSRVPAELVFDQGLGDLFVIRVAGNIAASSQIGSVEFAAANFGTRLVVVLGHSRCGAVQATVDELRLPAESPSPHLLAIVERIRPSVEGLLAREPEQGMDMLVEHAVRANIAASVKTVLDESEVLQQLIKDDGLLVVGAEYSLDSGVVEFFDYEQ